MSRPPVAARTFAMMLLATVTFVACSSRAPERMVIERADLAAPPAGPGASTPYLATAADGSLWASWIEPGPDSVWMLRAAHRAAAGTWSPAQTIVRDSLLFANWADFPSIAVDARGRLIAHFLRRTGGGKYAYHAWVTSSIDSARTWSAPQRLHADTGNGEHGFAALVPNADGSVDAAWLDGRGTAAAHTGMSHDGESTGAMSLGAGGLDSTLRVRRDTLLDIRTCDCCQVAGAALPNGAIFAYRDRSPDEVRDIAVVRRTGAQWQPSAVVHADGWVTKACPVNGPAIATRGERAALAWFTNARDSAKVQVVRSTDAGATWSTPARIDDGTPLGRVDIEMLADGSALVVWLERTGKGVAEVRAKRVSADGAVSAALTVASTTDARPAGFPRLAVAPAGSVFIAWRELSTPSQLRLAQLTVRP